MPEWLNLVDARKLETCFMSYALTNWEKEKRKREKEKKRIARERLLEEKRQQKEIVVLAARQERERLRAERRAKIIKEEAEARVLRNQKFMQSLQGASDECARIRDARDLVNSASAGQVDLSEDDRKGAEKALGKRAVMSSLKQEDPLEKALHDPLLSPEPFNP